MKAQSDKHDRDVHRPVQTPPERIAPDMPAQDARQGKKLGTVRWVLGISVALAVIALLIVYFIVPAPQA
jgi:hypothetical protein